ncbi:MAG: class II aldolase/adducin family protein [Rhodospirillaceae bacterium]|jgi:ribulose-5-phosphate 4-epimerase/fuculose-1-phosphate aldolase|nr:class II aldolase/adducin family protein [Rhodospirillaceae bacterium]
MNQITADFKHDRNSISDAEWDLRVQLAAAYRLVDYFGWCELIYGHLTARVPGPEHHFLINPYGLNYDEMTASNLVKIDLEGNKVDDTPYDVNEAGFIIHSAIHMTDADDNRVVMHTHTRAGMAVAGTQEGLQQISMNATMFHNEIAYHDYEGPSLYLDERERLVKSMDGKKALILRNHGLLTVGRTVPEAFQWLYRLERACQVQVDAGAAGTLAPVGENMAAKSGADVRAFISGGGMGEQKSQGAGELEFAALMRKIDKIDSSYRD